MKNKLLSAFRLLRRQGPAKFAGILFERAGLQAKIYMRGSSKVVELDHCHFALGELPNTSMKLELLTGGYEKPEREAVLRFIQPDWAIVELGACIGVVACVTNKLLKDPTRHVVLEINPLVLPHLKSNRDANGCAFEIIDRALAYDAETVTFNPSLDFWGTSQYHHGGLPPVTVHTTTLAHILSEQGFEQFALICDIEGQEYELIMREPGSVAKAALIIMEVHPHVITEDKVQTIISRLAQLGFDEIAKSANVITFRKSVTDVPLAIN